MFSRPKARPPAMTKKKHQKKFKPTKKLTEVEQLRRQVAELEAQKVDLGLDNLIQKSGCTIAALNITDKKQNSFGDSTQLPSRVLLNKPHLNCKTYYVTTNTD